VRTGVWIAVVEDGIGRIGRQAGEGILLDSRSVLVVCLVMRYGKESPALFAATISPYEATMQYHIALPHVLHSSLNFILVSNAS